VIKQKFSTQQQSSFLRPRQTLTLQIDLQHSARALYHIFSELNLHFHIFSLHSYEILTELKCDLARPLPGNFPGLLVLVPQGSVLSLVLAHEDEKRDAEP
jgi:hypothetical protein